MEKELKKYDFGDYIFEETNVTSKYLIYRKDHNILSNIGPEIMNMYKKYINNKMMQNEKILDNIYNIDYEFTDDGRRMYITAYDLNKTENMDEGIKKR